MLHAVRGLGLAATLALISSFAVAPQARAQSTSANVYVQVGGPAGAVYGYNASTSGQLTAIPGSPFSPGTKIIAGTNSRFFTLGHTLLHSWGVASNGAIGSQLSQVPILDYAGSECGGGTAGIDNAVLDHTGQYAYVVLQNGGDGTCAAYQTYKINSDGSFTFGGDTTVSVQQPGGAVGNPSVLGNETFGYADDSYGSQNEVNGFQRESSGTLRFIGAMNVTFSGSANYTAFRPDASPSGNYVALQLYPNDSNPPQLGIFMVDSQGNLTTTNTSSNMPTAQLDDPRSTFSPDGKMVALYAGSEPSATLGNGIEIYDLNGINPPTLHWRVLNGHPIDQVAWDGSNHLYAISQHENMLWVIEVLPSSITQDAALSITTPYSLVVVNQTPTTDGVCSTPSSEGINVCSPAEGATVSSPVLMDAAANVSGGVFRIEVWNGSTKLATVSDTGIIDQTVPLASGSYKLTFVARNSSGTHVYATRDITVK